jgi:sarcosine oxidase
VIPPMADHFDVIVIGVGAMGSATCWSLAKRGLRVLGLEQFDIPHSRGSSHGYSRMTRKAYCEHPDYVPLVGRANELWSELEQESGEKILHLVGGLYMGRLDGDLVGGSLKAARKHDLAHEVMDQPTLARRFPQFTLPEDWSGVLEPEAGFLLPELAISAMTAAALRHGAEVHGHEEVVSWKATASGVSVVTRRATYHADKVVFSGGAWSSQLVRDLGVELVVTRQVLGWVWPRKPELFKLGTLPVWMIDASADGAYYGFPMITLSPGLKLAWHGDLQPTDPNRVERNILPGDEATFRPGLERFIPLANGPVLAMRTCLYTNTPDQHFIIDHHPAHDRVVVAAGFSGHGFKFASVIGEVMADLATSGRTELPIGFLGLSRFGKTGKA